MIIDIKEITEANQDALRLPNEPFLNDGKCVGYALLYEQWNRYLYFYKKIVNEI